MDGRLAVYPQVEGERLGSIGPLDPLDRSLDELPPDGLSRGVPTLQPQPDQPVLEEREPLRDRFGDDSDSTDRPVTCLGKKTPLRPAGACRE